MGKKTKLFSPRAIEENDLDQYAQPKDDIIDPPKANGDFLFDKIAKKIKVKPTSKPVSKGIKIELKPDKNLMGDFIYYYKGSMLKINIQGVLFAQWCPTFVPANLRDMVNKSNDFEKYIPGKSPANGVKQTIGITMPSDLENFVFAITALERIRMAFPMCAIDVVCAPDYKKFLPSYANHVPYRQGRVSHYRFYDLSENKMNSYWLTEFNQAHFSKHILFLQAIGLNLESDKQSKPMPMSEKRTGYKTYVLHSDDALAKEATAIIDSENVVFCDIKEFDVKEMNDIKCLISTCDNRYLTLAGYLGIPTLAIINTNILKHQTQLKLFNVKCYSYPSTEDLPKAVSQIREFITKNGIS